MKQKILTICTAFLLCLSLTSLQAQEAVSATGGESSGSGGSASYTVGQIAYTVHTGTNGNSITQGVQQPYEISVVTAIPEAENIIISISAYPNPANDYLTLSVDNFEAIKLSYQLYDMNGKLLESKKITADKTKIVTNELTPAIYFLKVSAVSFAIVLILVAAIVAIVTLPGFSRDPLYGSLN